MALSNLLAFLAVMAFGQQNYAPAVFRDFRGGINDNTPAIYIEPNESPAAQNVVIDEPLGAVSQRNGYTFCGNLPSGIAPKSLFEYAKTDGTRRLVATDWANYYQTADCQTWTTIKTGLSSAAQPSFAVVRDKLWVANRSTNVFTWDGTTAVLLNAAAGTPSPSPPVCAYLAYYRNRVFCARTTSYPSGVAFSALTDSSGNDVDPSTGSLSWPAINIIQIERDDGYPLTGLKVYRGEMFAFKQTGIWHLTFNNEWDIGVVKTLSSVGTKFNSSIVEIDNLLYFVGPDGIYAFDGDSSARLSDKILNKFLALNQPAVNALFNSWTTQSQFEAGTLSSTTAAAVAGEVVLSSRSIGMTNGNFESGLLSPATGYAYGGAMVDIITTGRIGGAYSAAAYFTGGWACTGATLYIFNVAGTTVITKNDTDWPVYDGSTSTLTLDTNAYLGQVVYLHFKGDSCGATGYYFDLWTGSVTLSTSLDIAAKAYASRGWLAIDNIQTSDYYSSGTIKSDVVNAVSVSSWSTLDATYADNGGSIDFMYRVGHDTADISTRAWVTIAPGSLISGTTNQTYVQWMATFTARSDNKDSPHLYDVAVNWAQGGDPSQTIYSVAWKNRLWISASTGTSTTNNMQFVKTRHPLTSWMVYDMPIGPMTVWNDRLYVGASTCASVYRGDYGSTDDGRAIEAYWTTKDEVFQLPSNSKNLQEMVLDYEKGNAASLNLSYSKDYGDTWTSRSVNAIGSGRSTARQFVNGGNSRAFRFRLSNSTLGQTFKVYGIDAYAIPYRFRE